MKLPSPVRRRVSSISTLHLRHFCGSFALPSVLPCSPSYPKWLHWTPIHPYPTLANFSPPLDDPAWRVLTQTPAAPPQFPRPSPYISHLPQFPAPFCFFKPSASQHSVFILYCGDPLKGAIFAYRQELGISGKIGGRHAEQYIC